jgi:hypothetical protein
MNDLDPVPLDEMRRRAGEIRHAHDQDEIDALRNTVDLTVEHLTRGQPHTRELSMALTKADEMLFWMRAHKNAG